MDVSIHNLQLCAKPWKKSNRNVQLNEIELLDALTEFPVGAKGSMNRSRIGWILKKNAGRIIDGYRFERGEADGRTAWRVTYSAPQ